MIVILGWILIAFAMFKLIPFFYNLGVKHGWEKEKRKAFVSQYGRKLPIMDIKKVN